MLPGALCAVTKDTRQPSLDILIRLATLYRVSTDYLLGCHHKSMADLSGLTVYEQAMILEIVNDMTEKNKKIAKLEGRDE